jgi:2-phospho-L-lactate guanylyltransferase (CobY/MobA/RfbA family)
VSKSDDVLRAAVKRGFAVCSESKDANLNDGVALGVLQAQAAGFTAAMVVPIGLPWMKSEHLRRLISWGDDDFDVTIITDRAGTGANVMLRRPIETAVFGYGKGSADRHGRTAAELGLRVTTRKELCLSFDLVTPQDMEILGAFAV